MAYLTVLRHLGHYLTCRWNHPRCLLCLYLEGIAYRATEGDWKWYILAALVMLTYGMTHG